MRGTLHRCAKDGSWSNRFSRPSCRARAGTRGNAKLVPPRTCGAFQWYFRWQRVNLRLRKLDGEAFRRMELADLTKILRSANLEIESTPLLRKTPLWPPVPQMPRTSLALGQAWRDRGVGGCEKTAVHKLEVCFCKILTRSNYRCGQRWGLLERIFISESGKLTAATG